MSRPLGAKVHYNHIHTPIMMGSQSPCDTTTTSARSSWYNDDDDNDKHDDLSSSSYSSLVVEKIAVPCWGGWLLKLTTHRQQLRQQQQKHIFDTVRKPSLKVMTSSSSATSDDSELGHDDEDDDHESSSCGSRCMTPPCPPSVSFPNEPCGDEVELTDEMQMIRVLEIEGDRFEQQGLLLDALNVYQRLLELLRATGQSAKQIGKVHYRTGIVQYKRHFYNEALCHFDQALFIYQLNYDPDHEVEDDEEADDMALDFHRVYLATGHVHLTNQNPYRAIDYFHRALQFVKAESPVPSSSSSSSSNLRQRQPKHESYYAQVLQALGTAYEAVGDDAEARLHYSKAAAVIRTTASSVSLQK